MVFKMRLLPAFTLIAVVVVVTGHWVWPRAGRRPSLPKEPQSMIGAHPRGAESAPAGLICLLRLSLPVLQGFAVDLLPKVITAYVDTGRLRYWGSGTSHHRRFTLDRLRSRPSSNALRCPRHHFGNSTTAFPQSRRRPILCAGRGCSVRSDYQGAPTTSHVVLRVTLARR